MASTPAGGGRSLETGRFRQIGLQLCGSKSRQVDNPGPLHRLADRGRNPDRTWHFRAAKDKSPLPPESHPKRAPFGQSPHRRIGHSRTIVALQRIFLPVFCVKIV